MDLLTLALLLLVLLVMLLGAGLWISMSLAAVGYVAMVMVHPSPGLFLASAFWESTALLDARGAAAVRLDGRDPVPHQAVGGDVRRPRALARLASPAG